MRTAAILDAVRTPVGRYGGALKDVRVDELAATCLGALVTRNHLDPASVEDVILGCANQAGEDNRNLARMALLLAGFPVEVAVLRSSVLYNWPQGRTWARPVSRR